MKIIKIRKLLLSVLVVLMASTLVATGVYADEEIPELTFKNSLTCLYAEDYDPYMGTGEFLTPNEVIANTYWADLQQDSLVSIHDDKYYGVFPKYLLKPNETALKDIHKLGEYSELADDVVPYFPSIGISSSKWGIETIGLGEFYRLNGYLKGDFEIGEDGNLKQILMPLDGGRPLIEGIPFCESDLLSKDEVINPLLLTAYADLMEGKSASSKIGEHALGDNLNLNCSLYMPWFKRLINGVALFNASLGNNSVLEKDGAPENYYEDYFNNTEVCEDVQLVFTLDIPVGIKVEDPKAILSGLEDFDVETKFDDEANKLIISVRLAENKRELWKQSWTNLLENVNGNNPECVNIAISGLSVDTRATVGDQISIRATVAGFYDLGIGNVDGKGGNGRYYLYGVAKQSQQGRDEAINDNLIPNLISYTFKVKEPETITVTPIDLLDYEGGIGYGAKDEAADLEEIKDGGMPLPIFKIEGIEPDRIEKLVFIDNDTSNTSDQQHSTKWAARRINDTDYYYILGKENNRPMAVQYKDGDIVVGYNENLDPNTVKELYKELTIALIHEVDQEKGILKDITAHDGENAYYVKAQTGKLTIREITKKESPIVIINKEADNLPVISGYAEVIAPADIKYTLNSYNIPLSSADVGLLFDDIYDKDINRSEKLIERTLQLDSTIIPEKQENATRNYETKYLDLVAQRDGNVVVKPDQPLTIIWGYPKGSDENTKFTLLHFTDLHRGGDGSASGYNIADIESANVEKINVINTKKGIQFETKDFSPFILIWDTVNSSKPSQSISPVVPVVRIPKTGIE